MSYISRERSPGAGGSSDNTQGEVSKTDFRLFSRFSQNFANDCKMASGVVLRGSFNDLTALIETGAQN
jgi:hypothetical protein